MPAAIRIEGLTCRLGGCLILDDIAFSVDEGRYLSVIGPNGAGKTTLIRCINRIVQKTSGTIEIFGKDLDRYAQRELAKVVSYVPQADGRFFPYTAFEFALMGRYPHLSPFSSVTAEDKRATRAALAMTGAQSFEDRRLDTLSGGERQIVFIAAAIAQGARTLLLDEPAAFLDYKHQVEVCALLRKLNREEGMTIVAVTHDVNGAVLSGDGVLALKKGKVVYSGAPGGLLENGRLEAVYDTAFAFIPSGEAAAPIVVPKGEDA